MYWDLQRTRGHELCMTGSASPQRRGPHGAAKSDPLRPTMIPNNHERASVAVFAPAWFCSPTEPPPLKSFPTPLSPPFLTFTHNDPLLPLSHLHPVRSRNVWTEPLHAAIQICDQHIL